MSPTTPAPQAIVSRARVSRARPKPRRHYRKFDALATRWMDNDVYGHLNNVVYHSFFDTAVNRALIDAGVLDSVRGDVIGLAVQTHCDYFAPLSFPQPVETGLRVARVGRSSVRYEIGLFAVGTAECAACGHFVHVYVHSHDRLTRRDAIGLC